MVLDLAEVVGDAVQRVIHTGEGGQLTRGLSDERPCIDLLPIAVQTGSGNARVAEYLLRAGQHSLLPRQGRLLFERQGRLRQLAHLEAQKLKLPQP